ncbi:hypothetical protein LCGC14_1847330 [marine sediment metagenome]|uniref:Uncharacterized protein n=1 Tax=marine sediment metagenome TaxID=412755 RepID=A0A0F9GBL8_9ZZZZ
MNAPPTPKARVAVTARGRQTKDPVRHAFWAQAVIRSGHASCGARVQVTPIETDFDAAHPRSCRRCVAVQI